MSRNFTFCACISLDKLALVYVLMFFPLPLFWLVIHPGIHFWRRLGNRSFWIALPVWALPGTAVFLLRHRIFAERFTGTPLTWVLGLTLLGLMVYIEVQTRQEFGLRRLLGLREMERRRRGGLITGGIYARVRHPRYLGYMLGFGGLAFLTGAVGIFLLAIVTILLYVIVVPLEERELRERYGAEYEAYRRAVPRFLPRLRWRI